MFLLQNIVWPARVVIFSLMSYKINQFRKLLYYFMWTKSSLHRITLIGGPVDRAPRAGWRAMFPNEKRELSADCTEDKTERGPAGCTKRRCGGLRKRAGRGAEKGSPPDRPFPQPSLMCSPLAPLNVQPTGQSCSADCRPALLCSSPARG